MKREPHIPPKAEFIILRGQILLASLSYPIDLEGDFDAPEEMELWED